MKSIVMLLVVAILALFGISSFAQTEAPKDRGKEVIDLKMGPMVLPFKHWKHQQDLNNECYHCHNKKIGQIEGWSKNTAHQICIACHDLEGKGPVECVQCHKK